MPNTDIPLDNYKTKHFAYTEFQDNKDPGHYIVFAQRGTKVARVHFQVNDSMARLITRWLVRKDTPEEALAWFERLADVCENLGMIEQETYRFIEHIDSYLM